MTSDVLSDRALGRATLARQHLLERASVTTHPVTSVVSELVGLQSQVPNDPYVALWSRLDGFRPAMLGDRLEDRSLVRMVALRGTIHLLTADDAASLRPLAQPVLERELRTHGQFKAALAATDAGPVVEALRTVLAAEPLSTAQLRAAIAERFPHVDPGAMALACRNRMALVQVPPRGVWGRSLAVTLTPLEAWVGRELAAEPRVDELVLRIIGAFGPLRVADLAALTALTGLRQVVDRVRPHLRTFRNDRGQELFDLPDAPRPDPDTPAPARFLPTYDDVVLGDPSRFVDDGLRHTLWHATGKVLGTAWHDGRVVGSWTLDETSGPSPTLVVNHIRALSQPVESALELEAQALLAFLTDGRPDATEVRFTRLDP